MTSVRPTTNIAVINYGPRLDYPAMLPELVDKLHVFSHNELQNTEGLAHYEHIEDCESVPYPELMIRRLAGEKPFSHVVTDNEYDLERAARIRADFGISGQSPASALSFRDKLVMKEVAGHTVATARFARLETIVDLTRFIERCAYPVVVKPVKQGGSRDIAVLRGDDDLVAFSRRPWRDDLMAEEFIEGPMYHVDAVLGEGYRFVASSRYLRSCLGVFSGQNNGSVQLHPQDPFAKRLAEFLDRTLEAFDTPEVSAYHLEVFHTPEDGLVLCEIASRIGGDRIPLLTRATYGVDLHTTLLRQLCGLPVGPPPTAPPAAVHGSVSILPQGRPVRAPGRPPFEWVRHYEVNEQLAPGAVTVHSASHLCFVIVCGADTAEVERRLLQAEAWLLANLEEAPYQGS
ncbi:acetyl-CoA carboxylase biotin carboxylase subunit family protein [Streptomyces sp. NPDC050485]|uniref:acetyl-CoA carboxylase biotin carboxylase subunit family protein n=1 Tax=Streptomyces sp. NPDC050485 TaxID=3365617 RepID=UPI0037A95A20